MASLQVGALPGLFAGLVINSIERLREGGEIRLKDVGQGEAVNVISGLGLAVSQGSIQVSSDSTHVDTEQGNNVQFSRVI